jgi:amidase
MASNHVVSRTVRDSAALLDATAGADVGAPYVAPATFRSYTEEALSEPASSLRIGVQFTPFTGGTVAPECVAAVEDVAGLCADLGHKIEIVDVRVNAEQMHDVYKVLFCTLANVVIGGRAAALGREIRAGDAEPITMELIRQSKQLSASDCMAAWYLSHAMARDFSRRLQHLDMILSPTSMQATKEIGLPSLVHGDMDSYFEHLFADVSFTAIFNIAGLPAMSIPVHWNQSGLPIEVHFGAQYGREDILFQLAGQLERARPWFHHYARCMPWQ